MAIVTTYVCDVTGKSGTDKAEFVSVDIAGKAFFKSSVAGGDGYSYYRQKRILKLVHIDVAEKLGLIEPKLEDKTQQVEVSFEGKLKALLTDLVQEVVDEAMQDH